MKKVELDLGKHDISFMADDGCEYGLSPVDPENRPWDFTKGISMSVTCPHGFEATGNIKVDGTAKQG